jgi:beta-galactosidase
MSADYPFKINPPLVTDIPDSSYTAFHERNPTGSYRRTFELPEHWDKRRVFIRFEGVQRAVKTRRRIHPGTSHYPNNPERGVA